MNIRELAQGSIALRSITCDRHEYLAQEICSLVFHFENGDDLAIEVNADTDELVWIQSGDTTDAAILAGLYPSVMNVYGLRLIRCWEMVNHQGYFDAMQLEFIDAVASKIFIIQFKVAASSIGIFEVNPTSQPKQTEGSRATRGPSTDV
jgi:hypothetical protein